MAEANSNTQIISGAIVLVFISVMLFKSCVKTGPTPIDLVEAEQAPMPSDNELLEVLKDSDQFKSYQAAFMDATRNLIIEGRCKSADFKDMGGWVKSAKYKDSPVFFTYCGGLKAHNKIHLDANTGKIWRGES